MLQKACSFFSTPSVPNYLTDPCRDNSYSVQLGMKQDFHYIRQTYNWEWKRIFIIFVRHLAWLHCTNYLDTQNSILKSGPTNIATVRPQGSPSFLTKGLVLTNSTQNVPWWRKIRTHADLLSCPQQAWYPGPWTPLGDLSDSDFLIGPLAGNPDTGTPRHTLDTAAPDVLVELHVWCSLPSAQTTWFPWWRWGPSSWRCCSKSGWQMSVSY